MNKSTSTKYQCVGCGNPADKEDSYCRKCDMDLRLYMQAQVEEFQRTDALFQRALQWKEDAERLQKENEKLKRHLKEVIHLADYYSNTLAWSEGDFLVLSKAGAFLESIKKETT